MTGPGRLLLSAAAAVAFALAAQAPAVADDAGVKVGVLTCDEASGWGLVFGSSHEVHCTFSPTPDRTERYVGHIDKYGVDVGYQSGGVLVWAVFSPTANIAPGALDGSYGGVTAGATVGGGASANALVGGSNKTISLQPVSFGANAGLNVAAGVGALTLHYQP